jgi:hypothetical protein
MKHPYHTTRAATAALAAALALASSPLAAQDAGAQVTDTPVAQSQPDPAAPPVAASPAPAPTVDVPALTPSPEAVDASASQTTMRSTRSSATSPAPTMRRSSHATVTRTTTVTHTMPAAAVPPPANDVAAPVDTVVAPATTDAAPPVAANPDGVADANQPTNGLTGTIGVFVLALLALIIAFVAFLFMRRRSPVTTQVVETPAVTHTLAEPAGPAPAETVAASQAEVMATPTALRQRDADPVRGALPSDGAAVDLPASMPETYEERSALLDKMVAAGPDKANPFTDRRQRLRRARLIMQSLGHTFDREPLIDLSQYPNNWPELARQYHKAA